jgi:hypothetical protein
MSPRLGLRQVSIQFSYTSPLKCKCSSPSRNHVSCSLLTSCLCSLSCLSNGNVIYGISYLYFFICLSCGDVICGTFVVYLIVCTIVGIARTIVGITYGSTLPLIIFCAFTYVLSCSFFTFKLEAHPSSTLLFLLRTLLGEFVATFFLFSNVVYISSLILLTLVDGFCGFSFWCTNIYQKIFANTKAN